MKTLSIIVLSLACMSTAFANENNIYNSLMEGIQHRVSVMPGSLNCMIETESGLVEPPEEEMVQFQYDASVKLVHYFMEERDQHISNHSDISETDILAMNDGSSLRFDCIEDPIMDQNNIRNIKESYLIATKIIENRQ